MSRKGSGLLQVGGELVRSGFADASDEFRNIVLCLEEAGLSFVLEHPCRVLERDVLDFFKHARVRHNGAVIKSKVRNQIIKMKSSRLTRLLRLPIIEEEEDSLLDDDHQRALLFCGLPRGTTSVRRKNMNGEGKLLSDILGKVLLCKVGSHDYLSNDMFQLLVAIICRKRVDWGLILFERIKASLMVPNFGRIISLYLNQLDGDQFDMRTGFSIHHLKKIDSSIMDRWERVIVRPGLKKSVITEEEEVEERQEPSPVRASTPPAIILHQSEITTVPVPVVSSVEGEISKSPVLSSQQGLPPSVSVPPRIQSQFDACVSGIEKSLNLIPGHYSDKIFAREPEKLLDVDDDDEDDDPDYQVSGDGDDEEDDDDNDDVPDPEGAPLKSLLEVSDIIEAAAILERFSPAGSEGETVQEGKEDAVEKDEEMPSSQEREDAQVRADLPDLRGVQSDEFIFNDESFGIPFLRVCMFLCHPLLIVRCSRPWKHCSSPRQNCLNSP